MADFYNRLLEKIILPSGDLLLGTSFISELKKWRQISLLNEAELERLSMDNLRNLLVYAAAHVPYYKIFSNNNSADHIAWLKEFPVVDKSDYNNNIDSFLSAPKDKLIPQFSSGSSGVQGVVYLNRKEQSVTQAIQTIFWEWSGYYPGKPIVQTGMTPSRGLVKSIKDYFLRTKYYNAYGLDRKELSIILQSQFGLYNYHLGGYASSLYLLACEALDRNESTVKFDAAISWGDKMFPHYRNKIKEAFGCRAYDTYGSTEGTMIAAQKDLEYYYIISPHVYLEILDENDNEVPDGLIGRVVVTRLDGFSMPLIRYANGDLAAKLPRDKYPAKRELAFPLLEIVVGRDTDIIHTASGKFLIVHFFTGIFEFFPEIKQFKVIQRELSSIEIEFIPGRDFSPGILKRIEQQFTAKLGEVLPVHWKEVQKINPTASGKPQIIESYISVYRKSPN